MQIYNTLISVAQSRGEWPVSPKQYLQLIVFVGDDSQLTATTDKSARTPLISIHQSFESDITGSLKSRVKKEFESFNKTGGREAAQPFCDEMIQAIDTIKSSADKHRTNLCFRIKSFLAAYLPWLFHSPEKILNAYQAHLEALKQPILEACATIQPIAEICEKWKSDYLQQIKVKIQQRQDVLKTYTEENIQKNFNVKSAYMVSLEQKLTEWLTSYDHIPFAEIINSGLFKIIMDDIRKLKLGPQVEIELSEEKKKILEAYEEKGLKDSEALDLIARVLKFNSSLPEKKMIYNVTINGRKEKLIKEISVLQKYQQTVEQMSAPMVVEQLNSKNEV